MTFLRKILGARGESIALKALKSKGYRLIASNFRTKIGEIDLLMRDKDDIVIVEVKTKTGTAFGSGAEMVGYHKKQKLLKLAREVEQQFPRCQIRIDVVEIDASLPRSINHIINAVEDE